MTNTEFRDRNHIIAFTMPMINCTFRCRLFNYRCDAFAIFLRKRRMHPFISMTVLYVYVAQMSYTIEFCRENCHRLFYISDLQMLQDLSSKLIRTRLST